MSVPKLCLPIYESFMTFASGKFPFISPEFNSMVNNPEVLIVHQLLRIFLTIDLVASGKPLIFRIDYPLLAGS